MCLSKLADYNSRLEERKLHFSSQNSDRSITAPNLGSPFTSPSPSTSTFPPRSVDCTHVMVKRGTKLYSDYDKFLANWNLINYSEISIDQRRALEECELVF